MADIRIARDAVLSFRQITMELAMLTDPGPLLAQANNKLN
jgi:hypothetical protein